MAQKKHTTENNETPGINEYKLIIVSAIGSLIHQLPKTISFLGLMFFLWKILTSQHQPFELLIDVFADVEGTGTINVVFEQELLIMVIIFLILVIVILVVTFLAERKLRRADIKRYAPYISKYNQHLNPNRKSSNLDKKGKRRR